MTTAVAAPPCTRAQALRAEQFHRGRLRKLVTRRILTILYVSALALTPLAMAATFRVAVVPSPSMSPTLTVGSDVLIDRALGLPARGQVVAFTDPGGWLVHAPELPTGARILDALTGADSSSLLVKRVIGLPGDRVTGDTAGVVTVNGRRLSEPYVNDSAGVGPAFSVTVQPGCLFVLGDNRGDSADSRYHLADGQGCVPVKDMYGVVLSAFTMPHSVSAPAPESTR